jgi:hypothetical protein
MAAFIAAMSVATSGDPLTSNAACTPGNASAKAVAKAAPSALTVALDEAASTKYRPVVGPVTVSTVAPVCDDVAVEDAVNT